MVSTRRFWLYASLLLIVVLIVLAFAITSSSKPPITPPSIEQSSANESARTPTTLPSQQPVPDDFPAPAKKLHKVISDPQFQPEGEHSLDQKTQALNERIAALEEQLKAQGITPPPVETNTSSETSDTAARLEAIKAHMAEKEKQK